jgi:palmitoyltransferase
VDSGAVRRALYLLGPLLILVALAIISFEAYTFFRILLPMMHAKHAGNPYRTGILMAHSFWTVFVFFNIYFNYACGILQKHTGPHYDQVVEELAEATEFHLPRTPEEIAIFEQELNDRLVMSRRNKGESATIHTDDAVGNAPATKRRHNGRSDASFTADSTASLTKPQSVIPKVPSWMLGGPFEWGYCTSSKQPKPPRSHFDPVSKALVLNLDHYCPWMFNASESFGIICHAFLVLARSLPVF